MDDFIAVMKRILGDFFVGWKFKYLRNVAFVIFLGGLIFILSRCVTDLSLNDVDMKMDMSMNMAIPIGEMNFKVGDFLNPERYKRFYIDEKGLFHFRDSIYNIEPLTFYSFDIKKFTMTTTVVKKDTLWPDKDTIIHNEGDGFLSNFLDINIDKDSFKFPSDSMVRIDKIVVPSAEIRVRMSLSNLFVNNNQGIKPWHSEKPPYDSIKYIRFYLFPSDFLDFRDSIQLAFDSISGQEGLFHGVLKNCTLTISSRNNEGKYKKKTSYPFCFKVWFKPSRDSIFVQKTNTQFSACVMGLSFKNSNYDAVFGYFRPIITYDSTFTLDGELLKIKDFDELNFKVVNPTIKYYLRHQIGVENSDNQPHLFIHFNDLKTESSDSTVYQAKWKENLFYRGEKYSLNGISYSWAWRQPYIIPDNRIITDAGSLSGEPDNGSLSEVFHFDNKSIPNKISVSASLVSDTANWETVQYQITQNTKIEPSFVVDIPFEFNDTVQVADYHTVNSSIKINKLSIDSLTARTLDTVYNTDGTYRVDTIDNIFDTVSNSEIFLYVHFENSLPFAIEGRMAFVTDSDSQGKVDTIPIRVVQDSLLYSFRCPIPSLSDNGKAVVSPSEMDIVVEMTDSVFRHHLSRVAALSFQLKAVNASRKKFDINESHRFNVRIGLAASLDAIINLSKTRHYGSPISAIISQ